MNIQKGYLYFIKDLYFDKVKDKELLRNKENGNKRPAYYCFKDNKNSNIIWFVPISSRTHKYEEIVEHKKQLQLKKNPNKEPEIDTIVFGDVSGKKNVFLIQNMFPVIDKYIIEIFKRKHTPVTIGKEKQEEIERKAFKILNLVNRGVKGLVFPNILKIQTAMKEELIRAAQIRDFFNNKKTTFKEEVEDIINTSLSKEDLSLYFENVNDKFVKEDLDRIINTSEELGEIKRELNTYISVFSSHIIQASETLQVNSNLKDINLLVAIFNKAHNEKVANYVIKMLDSIEEIDYDILYKDKVIESNIQYCNNIINNRKIIADYYNENEENYIIKDIIDIIDNSETKFELKEYAKTISENSAEYKKGLDKLDYDKPLDNLKDAIVDIINRPPLSLNNDEEEDER